MKTEIKKEISITMNAPTEEDKNTHIPMCGWHANYANFKAGKHKGTITFTGNLNISIDNQYSFVVDAKEIVEFCLKKVIQHQRKIGPNKRRLVRK